MQEPPALPITRAPDPGTPRAALLALIVLLASMVTVFIIQQRGAAPEPEAKVAARGVQTPEGDDPSVMVLKVLFKLGRAASESGPPSPTVRNMLLQNIDGAAIRPEDKVRAAIVAGDVAGAPEAVTRLERVHDHLVSGEPTGLSDEGRQALLSDVQSLQDLYRGNGPLTDVAADELEKHHGYFGKVARTYGLPDSDPARATLLRGLAGALIFFVGIFALVGGLLFFGLICFITAIVLLVTGRLKPAFQAPAPGGSVYLEMVAVFFTGFVGLKLLRMAIDLIPSFPGTAVPYVMLAAQWLLLPVAAWPLLRGVPAQRWRQDLGLHTGRGFFVEAACGLFGYLAGLPLIILGLLVALYGQKLHASGGAEAPPHNPVVDAAQSGGAIMVLVGLLAVVWAPLVEETMFRGGLFRHLRSRVPLLVAAAISAIAFGSAHGYEWYKLGPVMAIGFNFALIREWRGSLVGPIVMHAANNATVLTIALGLSSLFKD